MSDSPYMGGKEYFGDRAIYFKHDSYEEFKRVLLETFQNPPKLNISDCENFCEQYKPEVVAKRVEDVLKLLLERR